jgi:hypothetical protein
MRPERNLTRLSYVSTLRPHVTIADIDAMVVKAADFNKAHEITGVLAIDDDRVCQILEGPGEAVDSLYASIQRDDRHHSVTLILHQPIEKSAFEAWGMVRRNMVDIAIYALTS